MINIDLSNCYIPKPKSGKERLLYQGKSLSFTLLDFWKWSTSDLLSNATRGVLAEFIVACALDIDINKPRGEWAAYDLITKDGIKIEVKSSSYLQSWSQKNYSTISCSIKKAFQWDSKKGMDTTKKQRAADVYVFCLLKHKDKDTVDPLDLSQWKFYVVSTEQLNNYKRSQHSITLPSLKKLTKAVDYNEIIREVDRLHRL
jgi:hypothetical protein